MGGGVVLCVSNRTVGTLRLTSQLQLTAMNMERLSVKPCIHILVMASLINFSVFFNSPFSLKYGS